MNPGSSGMTYRGHDESPLTFKAGQYNRRAKSTADVNSEPDQCHWTYDGGSWEGFVETHDDCPLNTFSA
jgi:hypothetical protein